MLVNAEDYESKDGKPVTSKCCVCDKELTGKWINYVPLGDFCPGCAHHVARILLEDIIGYHNNTSVSLLNVMYYGQEHHQGLEDNPGPFNNRKELLKQRCIDSKMGKVLIDW
ncbi:hypothetical protein EQO05_00995 [Methanosarcina sp. MSH10X1]|uniref:hypothetical protein n=1 Tax=Methanosarcina sp. MSH10X1 TaxID=2507075 RepID=UPI000FFC9C8E|nr:hypothetical protein [Methanosarcina sp. MSH10X1]RXA21845.1 hypothetical protein EQO05_00995 [Methanosarcina sp. MSH10X1]